MIELRHLTKSYRTRNGRKYIFRDLNIRFPEGKNIALMGRNGAGKSTLMRLIGGADMPDSGYVYSDSSISWPVGLSGGFQGSMSGRDNVKFVCRVYGFEGAAMREKVEYVQQFAEIGDWFDEPVRSYSSGMRSRVAFGLSMAFDFDYYLIDEVMSVGDAQFKKKCAEAFEQKLQRANIILVSHSMNDVSRMCDLALFVKDGQIAVYEDVKECIAAYRA